MQINASCKKKKLKTRVVGALANESLLSVEQNNSLSTEQKKQV
jgi:hypothetical protein